MTHLTNVSLKEQIRSGVFIVKGQCKLQLICFPTLCHTARFVLLGNICKSCMQTQKGSNLSSKFNIICSFRFLLPSRHYISVRYKKKPKLSSYFIILPLCNLLRPLCTRAGNDVALVATPKNRHAMRVTYLAFPRSNPSCVTRKETVIKKMAEPLEFLLISR